MQEFAGLNHDQIDFKKKYISCNCRNRRLRFSFDIGIKLFWVMVMLFVLYGTSACGNESSGTYVQKETYRIRKTINREWTFNYFPAEDADIAGYQADDFDDSTWPEVAIPHTWSTYETTGEVHPFIHNSAEKDGSYWWHGWGWYRKHFSIAPDQKDKKVFVEFEGVQKYCKVWVNGEYLGDHKGRECMLCFP